ncbi:hypothetical protein TWF281_010517 [Arthrobotrys megalospora]
MPCAAPYLPDQITLTPHPEDSPAVSYFLRHGWDRRDALTLSTAQTRRYCGDWLSAYLPFPFACREQNFDYELIDRIFSLRSREDYDEMVEDDLAWEAGDYLPQLIQE